VFKELLRIERIAITIKPQIITRVQFADNYYSNE